MARSAEADRLFIDLLDDLNNLTCGRNGRRELNALNRNLRDLIYEQKGADAVWTLCSALEDHDV